VLKKKKKKRNCTIKGKKTNRKIIHKPKENIGNTSKKVIEEMNTARDSVENCPALWVVLLLYGSVESVVEFVWNLMKWIPAKTDISTCLFSCRWSFQQVTVTTKLLLHKREVVTDDSSQRR